MPKYLDDRGQFSDPGAASAPAWGDITGKPTTFPPVVGIGATEAMAGNKTPTATERGGVLQQTAIADLSAAPTQQDINGILAKLRAAGILAT